MHTISALAWTLEAPQNQLDEARSVTITSARPPALEVIASGVTTHPRFRGPIRYTRYRRPVDDELATRDTISLMRYFVDQDARAPSVRVAAYQAIAHLPARDETKEIDAVWSWVRQHVRLIEDAELARPLVGASAANQTEVPIRPVDLLAMTEPAGDCDCQAMLAAAMLRALGIQTVFITIAADPEDLSQYSHVYLVAFRSHGSPVTLDVSHGPYPGWHAEALGKTRVWGSPVQLGQIDWGSVFRTGVQTGVQTTADILKARYGQPPAGTYVQQGENILYRQLPGTALQFPTTQIGGGWTSIVLLAVVALVLILAIRGRS